MRFGLAAHKERTLDLKERRTDSMEEAMVPVSSAANSMSVMAATMQTEDSALTSVKAVSKEARLSQANTCEVFIASREAMFKPVMLRRMLASPMMVMRRDMTATRRRNW